MKFKKSDWSILNEAEDHGLVASMTGMISSKRTSLNEELSDYYRKQMPNYMGSFGEYEGEDILYNINEYIEENNIDKHLLDFPFTSGTDIHLIPITDNLQLKIMIADEYYGDGDYSKYVMADFFMINENTNIEDVDKLVEFVREYLSA